MRLSRKSRDTDWDSYDFNINGCVIIKGRKVGVISFCQFLRGGGLFETFSGSFDVCRVWGEWIFGILNV